jgi:hypothetical protein
MSLWTRPSGGHVGYLTALCLILSVRLARRHYDSLHLETDEAGRYHLIDRLALPFTSVGIGLEDFNPAGLNGVWALGKIATFAMQRGPFIHLDGDVFLWERPSVDRAQVFAQSPESFSEQENMWAYPFHETRAGIRYANIEWAAALARHAAVAYNTGIIGGWDWRFLVEYAQESLDIAERNLALWQSMGGTRASIMLEQFGLWAFTSFYGIRPATILTGLHDHEAIRAGYTHLLGYSKHEAGMKERMEKRAREIAPENWQRLASSF